jgi:hypothetical protein
MPITSQRYARCMLLAAAAPITLCGLLIAAAAVSAAGALSLATVLSLTVLVAITSMAALRVWEHDCPEPAASLVVARLDGSAGPSAPLDG